MDQKIGSHEVAKRMATNKFSKEERVRDEPIITALFAKGNFSLNASPFRFSWIILNPSPIACQVLVLSSKKKLKNSVDRNRQKRQLRELYRLNKKILIEPLSEMNLSIALSVMYTDASPLQVLKHTPQFINALQKIVANIKKNHTVSVYLAD